MKTEVSKSKVAGGLIEEGAETLRTEKEARGAESEARRDLMEGEGVEMNPKEWGEMELAEIFTDLEVAVMEDREAVAAAMVACGF